MIYLVNAAERSSPIDSFPDDDLCQPMTLSGVESAVELASKLVNIAEKHPGKPMKIFSSPLPNAMHAITIALRRACNIAPETFTFLPVVTMAQLRPRFSNFSYDIARGNLKYSLVQNEKMDINLWEENSSYPAPEHEYDKPTRYLQYSYQRLLARTSQICPDIIRAHGDGSWPVVVVSHDYTLNALISSLSRVNSDEFKHDSWDSCQVYEFKAGENE